MTRIRASFIAILILSGGTYAAWKLRPAEPEAPASPLAAAPRFGTRLQVVGQPTRGLDASPVLLDIDAAQPAAEEAPEFSSPPVASAQVTADPQTRARQMQRRMDQLPLPRLASRYEQATPLGEADSDAAPADPPAGSPSQIIDSNDPFADPPRAAAPKVSRKLTPIPDPQALAWSAASTSAATQEASPDAAATSPTSDAEFDAQRPARLARVDDTQIEDAEPQPRPLLERLPPVEPPAARRARSPQRPVGNNEREGGEAGRTPIGPPTQTGATRWHRIRDGDTIESLASRYLGSPERWPELTRANPQVLANPRLLPIGARIRIPQ